MAHVLPNSNPGVLCPSPGQQFGSHYAPMLQICQLCNSEGHTAPFCGASSHEKTKCHICGRSNNTTWYCFYNDKGPNYMGMHTTTSVSPQSFYAMQPQPVQYNSYQAHP
ncbi:hypothetical protein ACFX12_032847 [Malus domestica]